MKNTLRLHLKRTSKQSQELQMVQNAFKKQSMLFEAVPQTHLKAISRTSNGSKSIRNQSTVCEAAPQTHTNAISRTSNRSKFIQTTNTTIWGCTSNAPQSYLKNFKHVHNLVAHVPDGHPFLHVELPCASCLCWMQAARMHSDMHGRHGEGMAMPRRSNMRFEESVPAVWCKLRSWSVLKRAQLDDEHAWFQTFRLALNGAV